MKILEELSYCNNVIKDSSLSRTRFYNLKRGILEYLIAHRSEFNLKIIPIEISLKDFNQLLISLKFISEEKEYLFHQVYNPKFYFIHFNFEKFDIQYNKFVDNREPLKFDAHKYEEYCLDLFRFASTYVNNNKSINCLDQAHILFPSLTFKRKSRRVRVRGTYGSVNINFDCSLMKLKIAFKANVLKECIESLLEKNIKKMEKEE